VGDVRATNYCDIALAVDEAPRSAHAIIVSAIDNLTKGAAGQAVQAMNIRFALEETAGLRR
jgi:N-acetyl-gamma-glutamylphosphate reductase